MNKNSRTLNAKKNITSAFINKMAFLVLNFVNRRIFIQFIGVEYLGISGLFSNVLTLLSMADLGLATAMNVRLYKPIAENDTEKLSAILRYFRQMYFVIAALVLTIGLGLIPFLKYIVNLDRDIPHLYLYYVIFVMENVVSYLFVYKSSIIKADQKNYLVNRIELITNFCLVILRIAVVVLFKNYLIYILLGILKVLTHNIVISVIADKSYPFLKKKHTLPKEEKKVIFKEVSSAFVYKVSKSIINGTDNILISVLIGTVAVGLYSNYYTITYNLESFIVLVFSALTSSVGNLIAKESTKKRYKVFKTIQLVNFWCVTFCSVCLLFLSQDFIQIIFGKKLLLDYMTVIAIVSSFYVTSSMKPLVTYREGTGMYQQIKYSMLAAAALNIILSVVLGKWLGLCGIFFATSISKLLTYFWYEPLMLYRKTFELSCKSYFIDHLKNVIVFAVCFGLCYIPIHYIKSVNVFTWLLKAAICFVIINIIYFILYRKTEEFADIKKRALAFIGRK